MKKVKLSDCPPGSKVRLIPNSVLLRVQFHIQGQTRLVVADGNGVDGSWGDSETLVYLEN